MLRTTLAALALVAGCGFQHGQLSSDSNTGDVSGPPDEPPPPDASLCMAASVDCASATVLRTCTAANVPATDKTCNWGCTGPSGSAQCAALVPHTGAVTTADTKDLGSLADSTLNNIIINGDTGEIGTGSNATSVRASGTGVKANIDYETRGTNDTVALFRFKKLTLTGTITLKGGKAIAIVAEDTISSSAVIDARGPCMNLGRTVGGTAGPGGFAGGAQYVAGDGPGGGGPGTSGNSDEGGGGGGNGAMGGKGGGANGAAGAIYNAGITALIGGSGGGGAGGGGQNSQSGGGGGGAVQIISNTKIVFSNGGGINAGGCGGFSTTGPDAGAGGGAGGTIILEAPIVDISAGTMAVNGGGGGAGATATDAKGEDGKLGRIVANGARSSSGNGGDGGFGGTTLAGQPGDTATKAGGGGGGVGRMLFKTRGDTGLAFSNTTLSPNFTDTGTTCTRAAATTTP